MLTPCSKWKCDAFVRQLKLDYILLRYNFLQIVKLNHKKNTKNKYNNDNEVFQNKC